MNQRGGVIRALDPLLSGLISSICLPLMFVGLGTHVWLLSLLQRLLSNLICGDRISEELQRGPLEMVWLVGAGLPGTVVFLSLPLDLHSVSC